MSGIRNIRIYLIILTAAAFVAALSAGILLYVYVYGPNVDLEGQEKFYLYIPTGSDYEDVKKILHKTGIVSGMGTFHRLAEKKNYPNRVMPGRYLIHDGMCNNSLINLLRSGDQHPVMLTFTNIRTREQLASTIAGQLEVDSLSILDMLKDRELISGTGLDSLTAELLFIPNTYEVYWNTSAEQLLSRMQREYNTFWNKQRMKHAAEINLSPKEVGILASIVQSETSKQDEMARIAGVYMNRLDKNIPLQADPTIIFALEDFSIRRVLNHHLTIDSPYNTYIYAGLPPGPINLPEPRVIDAVLNHEKHDYLYFSAKPDFSGYHAFAKTYAEHLANAQRYRQALNEMNVYR